MLKGILILCMTVLGTQASMPAQSEVHVDTEQLQAPRPLNEQTRQAAVQDYLQAWQNMGTALAQNRTDLVDADFAGFARDNLAGRIQDQAKLGLSTKYVNLSHDLQLLFYSPEGLSIELADTANYEIQVFSHGKMLASQPEHARYVVVLTPSEVRWRVRIFQRAPE